MLEEHKVPKGLSQVIIFQWGLALWQIAALVALLFLAIIIRAFIPMSMTIMLFLVGAPGFALYQFFIFLNRHDSNTPEIWLAERKLLARFTSVFWMDKSGKRRIEAKAVTGIAHRREIK